MTFSSTSDALATNRMGELTSAQRAKLRSSLWQFGCLGAFLSIFVGVFLFGIVGLWMGGEGDTDMWVALGFFSLLALGLAGVVVFQGLNLVIRLLDLSTGRVEQSDGRLTWRKSNYLPETPDRRLKLMDGLSLTPGPYRFYFLPRSGLVINAEALGGSGSAFAGAGSRDEDELTRALAQANNLQLEAYPTYRLGQLDEADKQRRISRAAWGMGLTLLIASGLGLVFALIFLNDADADEAWIVLLIFGGLDVLFSGLIVWSIGRTIADLRAGQVLMREGLLRRTMVRGNKSVSYYYQLGELRFSVSTAGYNALVEGRSYRVYYLPRSKVLLGIEPTVHDDAGGGGWAIARP